MGSPRVPTTLDSPPGKGSGRRNVDETDEWQHWPAESQAPGAGLQISSGQVFALTPSMCAPSLRPVSNTSHFHSAQTKLASACTTPTVHSSAPRFCLLLFSAPASYKERPPLFLSRHPLQHHPPVQQRNLPTTLAKTPTARKRNQIKQPHTTASRNTTPNSLKIPTHNPFRVTHYMDDEMSASMYITRPLNFLSLVPTQGTTFKAAKEPESPFLTLSPVKGNTVATSAAPHNEPTSPSTVSAPLSNEEAIAEDPKAAREEFPVSAEDVELEMKTRRSSSTTSDARSRFLCNQA